MRECSTRLSVRPVTPPIFESLHRFSPHLPVAGGTSGADLMPPCTGPQVIEWCCGSLLPYSPSIIKGFRTPVGVHDEAAPRSSRNAARHCIRHRSDGPPDRLHVALAGATFQRAGWRKSPASTWHRNKHRVTLMRSTLFDFVSAARDASNRMHSVGRGAANNSGQSSALQCLATTRDR